MKKILLLFITVISLPNLVDGQSAKQVTTYNQSWFSINTLAHVSGKWGVMADFHMTRINSFADPRFYFVRIGANYWLSKNVSVSPAYGHLWLAPTVSGWTTFSQENRIHEQLQVNSMIGKISVVQRLRNEQRWQQIIVNDKVSGDIRFTNRVRYLANFNIPLFKNKYLPSLALADEIMFQFGKDIVYNTFDQNRLFIGIRQKITTDFSADFGYMRVFQQKRSGYQYDLFHTLRLFFYYTPDFRKNSQHTPQHHGDE